MKKLIGKVLSCKMEKTAVVGIERQFKHPLYRKILKRMTKVKAHHENLPVKVGDMVEIVPCRPISKEKHYKLLKILE